MRYRLTLQVDSDTIDGLFSEILWMLSEQHRRYAYLRGKGEEARYINGRGLHHQGVGANHTELRITERPKP